MSNRLTFSLASLILIFTLTFAAMPVMAAVPDSVTVSASRADANDNWILKVTVANDLAVNDHSAFTTGTVAFQEVGASPDNTTGSLSWDSAKPKEYTIAGLGDTLPVDVKVLNYEEFRIPDSGLTWAGKSIKLIKFTEISGPAKVGDPTGNLDFTVKFKFDAAGGKPDVLINTNVGIAATGNRVPTITSITPDGNFAFEVIFGHNSTPLDADIITITASAIRAVMPSTAPSLAVTLDAQDPTPAITVDPLPAGKTKFESNFNVYITVDEVVSKSNLTVTASPTGKVTVGDPFILIPATGGSKNFRVAISAGSAAYDGNITVTAVVSDAVGNEGTDSSSAIPVNFGGDGTTPPANAPGTPTGLTATADQTAKTIALSWTAPASDGGSAITGYTITQSQTGVADVTATSTTTSHTTGVLTAGTYSFTVAATNANGTGTATTAVTATIDAGPAPVKAKATFSGTLSLTAQSIITVTFDKAVTGLAASDFTVTGGSVNYLQVKPNLAPAKANTVWQVAIAPDDNPFTESISVTIAATSTRAEPATTNGSLTTAVPKGTISSITAAIGANDQAGFIVDFTFAAALPDSESLMASDIKVMPQTATVGTPVRSPADTKVWQVLITPTKGMDTTIGLSDAGKLRFDYSGSVITVPKKQPPTVGPPTAAITISNHVAATGNFDIRVVLTPATGGSDVTGFDHTYLTVMDSSTPAESIPVVVETGTTANPVDPPLMDANLYVATLDYDTRYNPKLPLKVTINQSMLKTANSTLSASVGKGPVTPTPVKAKATFSGTLSLTAQSIITVTFDKAVTGLAASDFTVTGGSVNSLQVKPNLAATMANKVWQVAIDPDNDPFTETITVTIAPTSTLAEPATTNGSLTTAVPKGTISSITAAAGANDQAGFIVEFTFAAALPAGESLMANDIEVMPATAKSGTPVQSPADAKVWQVFITPKTGMNTTIGLSKKGKLRFAYSVSVITVPKKPPIVPPGTIAATHSAGTTTISSGVIGANGFAVIPAAALPDLQAFLRTGGSITLQDNDTTDDKNSRTVVISEVLWGYDLGMRAVAPLHKGYQFIELYNTTGASITLDGWKLVFTQGRTVVPIDIDQLSNRQGGGWSLADVGGQNGRIHNTTAVNPINRIAGEKIISMYRNINYYRVEKTDHDADAKKNRDAQLKDFPNGNASGSWLASKRWTSNPWILDSEGLKHLDSYKQLPGSSVFTATSVPRSPFVINEIGNSSGGANDWIELRNKTTSEQSLKNYQLSVVTADKKDTQLFHFHDKDYKVPAGGVVLIASTHPKDNDLAAGRDISLGADDQVLKGLTHLYVVRSFNIPDSGKTLLILRKSAKSHEKQHLGTSKDIIDVVGTLSIKDNTRGTSLWPLDATGGPHGNVIDGTDDEDLRAGKVYRRANDGGGTGEKHLAVVGYTGVGYDRHAATAGQNNNGTPGYDNGAVKGDKSDWMGQVTISEVMLGTEESEAAGRVPRATRLPQWFEIYNNSMTEAVSLNNWYLEIQNAAEDFDGHLHGTVRLPNKIVQPNQTVLVVSGSGLNSGNFPEQRTINIFTNSGYRKEFGLVSRGDAILNPSGFYIQLRDHKNTHVDEVGNIGLSHLTGRTGVGRRYTTATAWTVPSLNSDEGHRTSLIRVYDKGVARSGLSDTGWFRAADTNFQNVPSLTYYGNHRDFGTPGYRGGGPLPVSLSKFRPERLKETGEVVIRWITESELNNAGFNILRSDTRNGEYTKLNTNLIAGHGTTSERHTYEWKDTSAKPNVAYYYQIQDVSLDGQVNTLRVNRLKGHVDAAGKATTTWGELKALQ